MRQFSVTGELVNPVINRLVLRLIGEIALHERVDHADHAIDIRLLGGGWEFLRRFDAQSFKILEERLLEWLGEFAQGHARFARAADGLVIHVCNVHDAMDFVAAQFEVTLEQILKDVGAEVANMSTGVNGRTAGVHADLATIRFARLEVLDLPGVGVEETDGHY